jgi:hypothetical protein
MLGACIFGWTGPQETAQKQQERKNKNVGRTASFAPRAIEV